MKLLISSGTLFSDWHSIHDQVFRSKMLHREALEKLSSINKKMFKNLTTNDGGMALNISNIDQAFLNEATTCLVSAKEDQPIAWADIHSSLFLDFWNNVSNDSYFICFFCSPEYELASYLANNSFDSEATEEVLSAWSTRTKSMLAFFMQNKKNCLLVDVQSVHQNPGLLIQKINDFSETNWQEPDNIVKPPSADFVLYEYLAATLLSTKKDLSALFDDVRSTATVLGDDSFIFREIQERSKLLIPQFQKVVDQSAQQECDWIDISNELTSTKLQLHQTQSELEFYFLKEQKTAILNDKYKRFLAQNPLLKLSRIARTNEAFEESNLSFEKQVNSDE